MNGIAYCVGHLLLVAAPPWRKDGVYILKEMVTWRLYTRIWLVRMLQFWDIDWEGLRGKTSSVFDHMGVIYWKELQFLQIIWLKERTNWNFVESWDNCCESMIMSIILQSLYKKKSIIGIINKIWSRCAMVYMKYPFLMFYMKIKVWYSILLFHWCSKIYFSMGVKSQLLGLLPHAWDKRLFLIYKLQIIIL